MVYLIRNHTNQTVTNSEGNALAQGEVFALTLSKMSVSMNYINQRILCLFTLDMKAEIF